MSDEGNNVRSRADTSFKMCVCLLLLFIAICVIILLAGTSWSKEEKTKEKPESQGSKGDPTKGATEKSSFITKLTTVQKPAKVTSPPEPKNTPLNGNDKTTTEGLRQGTGSTPSKQSTPTPKPEQAVPNRNPQGTATPLKTKDETTTEGLRQGTGSTPSKQSTPTPKPEQAVPNRNPQGTATPLKTKDQTTTEGLRQGTGSTPSKQSTPTPKPEQAVPNRNPQGTETPLKKKDQTTTEGLRQGTGSTPSKQSTPTPKPEQAVPNRNPQGTATPLKTKDQTTTEGLRQGTGSTPSKQSTPTPKPEQAVPNRNPQGTATPLKTKDQTTTEGLRQGTGSTPSKQSTPTPKPEQVVPNRNPQGTATPLKTKDQTTTGGLGQRTGSTPSNQNTPTPKPEQPVPNRNSQGTATPLNTKGKTMPEGLEQRTGSSPSNQNTPTPKPERFVPTRNPQGTATPLNTKDKTTTEGLEQRTVVATPSPTTFKPKPKPKPEDGQQLVDEYDDINWTTKIPKDVLLSRKPDSVCETVPCKSAASRMLRLMDHSIDPCSDFYEFSCGGLKTDNSDWNAWKRISEQLHLINGTAPPSLQKFKTFYDSCVSHEYEFNYQRRIDGVLKLVNEVGKIIHVEPTEGTVQLTDLFAKLIQRQSLPFMDIDIDIDKQTSKFILKLTLPNPTSVLKERGRWSALTEAQKRCLDDQRHQLEQPNLDLTKIHNSYLQCQKNHTIYLNSVETVMKSLGFFSSLTKDFDKTQAIQQLRTTIEWDILDYLNELPPPKDINQIMLSKKYTIYRISDFQAQNPLLQWKELFNKVTGLTLEDSTMIQVYFPDYFKKTFKELKKLSDWKLNNALLAIYANNLYENLVIPQAKHSREMYCLKVSSNLFHDVSSNLYMRTWPETEILKSQKFMRDIFNRLKMNLTSVLQTEKWIDDDSRIRILTKLNDLELTFNKQTDRYNDENLLNQKYNPVVISTDFQENAVKMLVNERKMRYALVGTISSPDYLWSYFVNAYDSVPTSFYSKQLILAPLGMVKQSIKGLPGYITIARIGLLLATEIGRHFDPVGVEIGLTLEEEAKTTYNSMIATMNDELLFQVTKLVGHQTTTYKVEPELSANDRIAENTGFRLISETFNNYGDQSLLPWVSTSFSTEQIFYISVAQEYCQKTDMPEFMQKLYESNILPPSLRVENIITNSKQFAKAFECGTGEPMNNNPNKVQFPHLDKDDDEGSEL